MCLAGMYVCEHIIVAQVYVCVIMGEQHKEQMVYHTSQPQSTKNRDINGIFSVKKHKLALFFLPKNPHKKEGQSPKKVGQQFFDIKNRDCPSKIGTVGAHHHL